MNNLIKFTAGFAGAVAIVAGIKLSLDGTILHGSVIAVAGIAVIVAGFIMGENEV